MGEETFDLDKLEEVARAAVEKPTNMHGGYGPCRGAGQVWVDDGEASNFTRIGDCPDCAAEPRITVSAPTVLRLIALARASVPEGDQEVSSSVAGLPSSQGGSDPKSPSTLELARVRAVEAVQALIDASDMDLNMWDACADDGVPKLAGERHARFRAALSWLTTDARTVQS